MPPLRRRSVLAALGLALPAGLGPVAWRAARAADPLPPPGLRLLPFEEAVRRAFADADLRSTATRRVECGHSDLLRAGLQGCSNSGPFAGFPSGTLRITRMGSAPGPAVQGIRLYVCAVDLEYTPAAATRPTARPVDFSLLPPAPTIV